MKRIMTALAVGALALGSGVAHANHPSDSSEVSLASSAASIDVGDSVTLDGEVTAENNGGQEINPEHGSVTLLRSATGCAEGAEFDHEVGTQQFGDDEDAGETLGTFSFEDSPAEGTFGYRADYSGATWGGGQHTLDPASSACVEVTVNGAGAEGRDAPAWANDHLRDLSGSDRETCRENAGTNKTGSNWHGKVIAAVAEEFDGQSFADWDDAEPVRDYVDGLCGI